MAITAKGKKQKSGLIAPPPPQTELNTQRLQNYVNSQGGTGAGTTPTPTTPLPWDATEQTQEGLLNRNYQNQIAQYGQQEAQTRSDYGFDPQFASNPLTRANLLQASYDQARLGATNSMAARGQLYSGATSNALGYADLAHNKGYADLQTGYQNALNQISQGRIGARQSLDEGVASAQADALSRALGETPEPITPDNTGGGGTTSAKNGARKTVKNAARKAKIRARGVPQKSGLNRKGKK